MADSTDLHGRLGAGQLPLQDPESLLGRIIRLYRRTVSEYICSEFQRRYPDEVWFMTRVIEKEKDNPKREQAVKLMVKKFKEGKPPLRIFDPGHFPFLVRNHQEVFKDLPINSVRKQMHRIAEIRNDYHGHDNEDLNNDIVEEAASKCATVLRACGKESTAGDVERLLRAGYEASRTGFVSSPSGIADDSPPAQGAGPVIEDTLGLALLRDDDRGGQGEEARRREMDALSYRDPEAGSDMESAGREREKRPFFGGVLARLWASEAAQSGSSGGGGAFAAGGEVAQREPVRGRRRIPRIPVGRALLAVILVGIAVAFGFAVSDLWPRGDQIGLETESATAPSGEQARQQESSATEEQSAAEGEGNGGGAPAPPADTDSEPGGRDTAEPSSPEAAQTPPDSTVGDETPDSGDGGQAEAGDGEQTGAGGCTGDECPTESESQQERAGQAPSGGAGGGGTSDSRGGGQAGASGGEQSGTGGCTGDECPTESGPQQESPGQAPSSNAGEGGTPDSGGGSQTGAGDGEGTGEADCVTNEEGECGSEAGDEQETQEVDCVTNERNECEPEAGGEQDGDSDTMEEDGDGGLEDDDDTMDDGDWDNSELEEEEPGTTIVTADDGYPIITVVDGDGAFDPGSDAMDDDVMSHYSFDAEPEEVEPGMTIVNVPMGEPEDGLMEDSE